MARTQDTHLDPVLSVLHPWRPSRGPVDPRVHPSRLHFHLPLRGVPRRSHAAAPNSVSARLLLLPALSSPMPVLPTASLHLTGPARVSLLQSTLSSVREHELSLPPTARGPSMQGQEAALSPARRAALNPRRTHKPPVSAPQGTPC